jgi:hypothetical protein
MRTVQELLEKLLPHKAAKHEQWADKLADQVVVLL